MTSRIECDEAGRSRSTGSMPTSGSCERGDLRWPSSTAIQLSSVNRSSWAREDAPLAAPQLDLLGQAVRDIHRPAMVPELGIVALGGVVVQDDEVADVLVFLDQARVVFVDLASGSKPVVGKQRTSA